MGLFDSIGGYLGTSSGPTVGTAGGNSYLSPMGAYLQNGQGYGQAQGQVLNSPLGQGLYGQTGALGNAENKLNTLENTGFNLTQGDQSMYGQASDAAARQSGHSMQSQTNNLAQRGLGSSGAAGATFSGIQGNQNEQLAGAQQQIMQQRYQNTMQQIGQQQNFINSLGGQAQGAIGQNYGQTIGGMNGLISGQNIANEVTNQGNLGAANFAQQNKPENFVDQGIMGSNEFVGALSSSAGKTAGGGGGLAGMMG